MKNWIGRLYEHTDLARMGHHQRIDDANLGLGWIYYGLARTLRPQLAVVIGSWRGFVPLVIGKALADNVEGGTVIFIEPSLVDDFWSEPQKVTDWFALFGVNNVQHHHMTTQQYVETDHYRDLGTVGMLFIDGYHTFDQARLDHESFLPRLAPDGVVLFHDSVRVRASRIYGEDRVYQHRVVHYIDELKRRDDLQVMDLPYADGVTLVRNARAE
jgi:predicted O-methyltransferase YrrM